MASLVHVFLLVCGLTFTLGAPSGGIEVEVPEECKNKTFCDVPPKNYDIIKKRISELLPIHLQSDWELREGATYNETLSGAKDWHNCPTLSERKNFQFIDKFLVAQTDTFKQTIEIVQCANSYIKTHSKHQCFQDMVLKTDEFTTTCEQIYAKRLIYFYDYKNGVLAPKNYPVPVNCACSVGSTW